MGSFLSVQRLKNIDENISVFSFNNLDTIVKVPESKIYDGDTAHLVFKYNNRTVRVRARMAHYDCPEIKSESAQERDAGNAAKRYFTDLLRESEFYAKAHFGKNDKYGRPLVTLYQLSRIRRLVNPESINDKMLKSQHAVRYEGGKKVEFKK